MSLLADAFTILFEMLTKIARRIASWKRCKRQRNVLMFYPICLFLLTTYSNTHQCCSPWKEFVTRRMLAVFARRAPLKAIAKLFLLVCTDQEKKWRNQDQISTTALQRTTKVHPRGLTDHWPFSWTLRQLTSCVLYHSAWSSQTANSECWGKTRKCCSAMFCFGFEPSIELNFTLSRQKQ